MEKGGWDGCFFFFSDESRLTLYGLRSLATPAFAIYDVCIKRFEGFQYSFAVSKDDACCVWVPSPRTRLKHLMMFPNRNWLCAWLVWGVFSGCVMIYVLYFWMSPMNVPSTGFQRKSLIKSIHFAGRWTTPSNYEYVILPDETRRTNAGHVCVDTVHLVSHIVSQLLMVQ